MNKQWVLFHLREALEELTQTTSALETNKEYGEVEFEIALKHMYNHLNTAWNSRNESDHAISSQSDADFYAWRAFPDDLDMGS